MEEQIKELFRLKFLTKNSYSIISILEWHLLPEELKQEFINYYCDNRLLLPYFVFKEMQETLKNKYIDGLIRDGYYPVDFGLSHTDLSEDLLKIYIENIIGVESVSDELFDLFTTQQKIEHIKKSGKASYYITEYQFNHLKPLEKLDYIVYNGYYDKFMINWYKTWRDSIERETQMDSILN
jgi:hypothetical protein